MTAQVTDLTGTRDRLTPAEVAERAAEIFAGSGLVAMSWFLAGPAGTATLSGTDDGRWLVDASGDSWGIEHTFGTLAEAIAAAEAALDGAA